MTDKDIPAKTVKPKKDKKVKSRVKKTTEEMSLVQVFDINESAEEEKDKNDVTINELIK